MRASIALFALAAASASISSAALGASRPELSCANIDAMGVDKALKKSAYKSDLAFSHQLKQLRVAVKAFHGETYRDDMTIEEANELGEEVVFTTVKALDGKTYQGVNVGFGGGNSALYLFKRDTLELAPVVLIDGVECLALGTEN